MTIAKKPARTAHVCSMLYLSAIREQRMSAASRGSSPISSGGRLLVATAIAYLFLSWPLRRTGSTEPAMSNQAVESAVAEPGANFESLLRENRVFLPPAAFAARAAIGSAAGLGRHLYARSVADPAAFWAEAAGELDWFAPWATVLAGTGAGGDLVQPAAS